MRLLGAFVLLLQLQPFVGSALCVYDAEIEKAECAMPQQDQPVAAALTAVGAGLPIGCAGGGYCAPGAAAVIKFTPAFQIAPLIHNPPATGEASLAPGDPSPPPFHPPRA